MNVNKSEFKDMVGGVRKSPVVRRIMDVKAHSKYSALWVKEYIIDTNPYEYMCHFELKMQNVSVPITKLEAMKCKTFTQRLARPVLLWFHQFPSENIQSYEELVRRFIRNFLVNIKVSKAPDDLFTVQQREGEILRRYIERFNVKYINIPKYPDNVVVSTFKLGLLHGRKAKDDLTVRSLYNLK